MEITSPANPSVSPSGLRLGFFGTPEFAATLLDHLIVNGENVVCAVTTPDKPQGRGMKMRGSAVRERAEQSGIAVLTPHKHRDEHFLAQLRAFEADLFVVVAYKILPREVYAMPRLGSFNVHASLLPKYRGAAPINWAIIRGDTETGVTTFLLDANVDTGLMLLQEPTEIGAEETAGELHDKLMAIGAKLSLETVRGLASGTLTPSPQPPEGVTTAPKIFPADCVINFEQSAAQVHNFIRGLSPYPAAVTQSPGGIRLKVLRSSLTEEPHLPAGRFRVSDDGKHLFVGTASVPVELLELQREGKRAMSAEELLRGNRDLFEG